MEKNEFIFETKSDLVHPIVRFWPQNEESKLISAELPAFCAHSVHIWHENGEKWIYFWNKIWSGVSDCAFFTSKWGIDTNFCKIASMLSTFWAYLTWEWRKIVLLLNKIWSDCQFFTSKWGIETNFCQIAYILPHSVHMWHENGYNWIGFWNKIWSGVSDSQFLTSKWGIKTNFCQIASILSTFWAYLTWEWRKLNLFLD